jgi:hypothetical protein
VSLERRSFPPFAALQAFVRGKEIGRRTSDTATAFGLPASQCLRADYLVFKNGDRLTGKIVKSESTRLNASIFGALTSDLAGSNFERTLFEQSAAICRDKRPALKTGLRFTLVSQNR